MVLPLRGWNEGNLFINVVSLRCQEMKVYYLTSMIIVLAQPRESSFVIQVDWMLTW